MHIKKYYAGIFNGTGFHNFLPQAIKGIESVYIIKGTPGSGKSTLMKKIAHAAEELCFKVEYIYCSSDTSSLDGIILPSLSVAMVDGTSPHVMEASFPLAVETIINTGDFISQTEIKKKREEIIQLTNEKKKGFSRGEMLLRSASCLDSLQEDICSESFDFEKCFSYCKSFILKEKHTSPPGEIVTKCICSLGKDGISTLIPDECTEIRSVDSKYACFFLDCLKLLTCEMGIFAFSSPNPFDVSRLSSLYFPRDGILFTSSEFLPKKSDMSQSSPKIKHISSRRFEKKSNGRKETLKFIQKTKKLLCHEAFSALKEAMSFHSSLEEIYVSALNKEGLGCLAESLIISILENRPPKEDPQKGQ